MTRLRQQTEYITVAALLGLSRLLPERLVYGLFKLLALLMYAMLTDRRKLTLANISIVFPEMTAKERRRIAVKSYLNIADSLALNNLIVSGRISNERILELCDNEGWETLAKRGASYDEGYLVISGHLGNWELLPQCAGLRLSKQLHVIARETDNQILEEKIIMPMRKRFGMQVYYKKNALMHIVKAIKKGDICGLMLDQKLNPPQGFLVDFCGRPAPTGGSPALLQIRFGIPVQPIFLVKTAPHMHSLIVSDQIPWTDNGKPLEDQVKELTFLHQAVLEKMIRKYPEQWFWMHNRWGLKKSER